MSLKIIELRDFFQTADLLGTQERTSNSLKVAHLAGSMVPAVIVINYVNLVVVDYLDTVH